MRLRALGRLVGVCPKYSTRSTRSPGITVLDVLFSLVGLHHSCIIDKSGSGYVGVMITCATCWSASSVSDLMAISHSMIIPFFLCGLLLSVFMVSVINSLTQQLKTAIPFPYPFPLSFLISVGVSVRGIEQRVLFQLRARCISRSAALAK